MKLRIKGNSIRFRLTKGDIEQFQTTGIVQEQTSFIVNTFTYALVVDDAQKAVFATYQDNTISVHVPLEQANEWTTTALVGFSTVMQMNQNTLTILVEKDFECLVKRVGEDDTDAYPNPANQIDVSHESKK